MESTDSIETYAYGTSKDLVSEKEEIKNNVTKEKIIEYNPIFPQIHEYSYIILLIGGPGSGKANSLFSLINQQPDIDKIYFYAKDPYRAKYQFLIRKSKDVETKHFNDSKATIEYSNDIDEVYKNIEEYNPNKKRKLLIVFDDMIADMLSNKKLNPIVTELFIRGKKLNISLVFITQSYFAVPKIIRLSSTHNSFMKISNKLELQKIAFKNSSDIDFKDLINHYKKCTAKPYYFLVIDAILASDNPFLFRKILLDKETFRCR